MKPPTKRRERILVMGPWGAGKSYSWVKIAEWLKKTGGGKVYLLDTDYAAMAQSDSFEGFEDVVEWREGNEWPQYLEAVDHFRSVGTSDDWLVIDLMNKAWSEVQNWYIDQVYGKNAASFYLDWKKEKDKGGSPLADSFGTNWQVINKQYDEFIGKVLRWPGHILACTSADKVMQGDRGPTDSKEVIDTYGRFGYKPGGQKNLGFQFLSVLLMQPKGGDKWAMTSVKDLHRERVVNQEINDFVVNYLVPIAGWTLK